MTAGFELILPVLLGEARDLGLIFNCNDLVQVYIKERNEKLSKISMGEKLIGDLSRKVWYYSLEGLSDIYSTECIKLMIRNNGLICGSYGATAYALRKGINNQDSYEQIRRIVFENGGGVPNAFKCEIFDLSWSLNTLYYSGYPLDSKLIYAHVDKLERVWAAHKGMVGGSVNGLPPDADDISNTLSILTLTGRLGSRGDLKSLLKFLRGDYFVTYEAERTPSLSTNVHSLLALAHYQQYYDIREISERVFKWLKSKLVENQFMFQDKWHLSRYYSMNKVIIVEECSLMNSKMTVAGH